MLQVERKKKQLTKIKYILCCKKFRHEVQLQIDQFPFPAKLFSAQHCFIRAFGSQCIYCIREVMGEAIKFPPSPVFFSQLQTHSLNLSFLLKNLPSPPPYQITTNRVQLPPPLSHPNSANISQYYSPIPRPLASVILKITSSHSTDWKPTLTPSGVGVGGGAGTVGQSTRFKPR